MHINTITRDVNYRGINILLPRAAYSLTKIANGLAIKGKKRKEKTREKKGRTLKKASNIKCEHWFSQRHKLIMNRFIASINRAFCIFNHALNATPRPRTQIDIIQPFDRRGDFDFDQHRRRRDVVSRFPSSFNQFRETARRIEGEEGEELNEIKMKRCASRRYALCVVNGRLNSTNFKRPCCCYCCCCFSRS